MAYNKNSVHIFFDFIFIGVMTLAALRGIMDLSQETKVSLRDSKGISEF